MANPYQPATPANDKTQLWGILGIVVGLLCCPLVGIVFGVLSINEAKKVGKPRNLGIIAIVVSVIAAIGWTIVNFTVLNNSNT